MAKKKSKKYLEAAKQVEAGKAYDASEALALSRRSTLLILMQRSKLHLT